MKHKKISIKKFFKSIIDEILVLTITPELVWTIIKCDKGTPTKDVENNLSPYLKWALDYIDK